MSMPMHIDGGAIGRPAPYRPASRPLPAPSAPPDRCEVTPAAPQARNPAMAPIDVPRGPNQLQMSLEGPDPYLAVGGSHDQQEAQRDLTVGLGKDAVLSYAGRWVPGLRQSDAEVNGKLNALNGNPPLGSDGVEVTHGLYTSQVPNATPQQLFDHWVNHPNEVFNAGGMEIRPASAKLVDGGRYTLETGAAVVPTWLPVEISVDAQARSITIHTFDGHVLRGEQTFSFVDDGCGGTTIVQDGAFRPARRWSVMRRRSPRCPKASTRPESRRTARAGSSSMATPTTPASASVWATANRCVPWSICSTSGSSSAASSSTGRSMSAATWAMVRSTGRVGEPMTPSMAPAAAWAV